MKQIQEESNRLFISILQYSVEISSQNTLEKHKLTFCLNATVLMYLKHVIKTTVAFALILFTS